MGQFYSLDLGYVGVGNMVRTWVQETCWPANGIGVDASTGGDGVCCCGGSVACFSVSLLFMNCSKLD
jgi:hypothetical protein